MIARRTGQMLPCSHPFRLTHLAAKAVSIAITATGVRANVYNDGQHHKQPFPPDNTTGVDHYPHQGRPGQKYQPQNRPNKRTKGAYLRITDPPARRSYPPDNAGNSWPQKYKNCKNTAHIFLLHALPGFNLSRCS